VRILIADDQQRTRRSLRALLSTLVLMDIRMPEIDGLEATRGIKSRWPEIKVLVLSLYEGRQEEARAVGADLFVSKGGSPERLLCALSSLL
jgi:DNA-binding NarL/FixJ family response regulator